VSVFEHVRKLIHALSLGCFAGILVMGAGYLATSTAMPIIARYFDGDALHDGRAYQAWLRGVIMFGLVVMGITAGFVRWRDRTKTT
jgi:hypothetical protein